MAQVPEKVLAWLYSVLHEYQDPQRAYSDSARALSVFPSLSPRTEVYTYENGSSALLLTLTGTLPVNFRGTSYNFPVKLWVPQSYSQEPPIAYVNAGRDMVVRPGQHVGVDGRIYHPYLRDWSSMWDRASVTEFLDYLQQVFAREPPVISKAQQQQYQRPIGHSPQPHATPGASSGPPQLPPKQRVGSVAPVEMSSANTPPPRPPKPGEEYADPLPPRTSSRNVSRDGPPLPPLPHERPQSQQYAPSPQHQNGYLPSPHPGYQNGRPPGPPYPPQQQPYAHRQRQPTRDRSPVSPVSPVTGYSQLSEAHFSQAMGLPPPQQGVYQQSYPLQSQGNQYQQQPRPAYQQPPYQQQTGGYPSNQRYHNPGQPYQQPHQQKQAAPPDLLSDPFEVALPGPSSSNSAPLPAPPIPPNPEKEHLLQALSSSLTHAAQTKVSQNLSALQPLQVQHSALQTATQRLESELAHLTHLDHTLNTNEHILRRSIADCDALIANTRQKASPAVDEILVAQTLVANQLWNLCAEEVAARESMYVLQKAVDRGRVSGEVFVRQMRGLGREVFGKMVLARKCARGMGLEVGRGGGGGGSGYDG